MISLFENTGVILAVVMLVIGTFEDIRKREVHDGLWIVFGIIGIVISFVGQDIFSNFISIGISLIIAPFAIVLWRFGLFGGSDAFALIVLSILASTFSYAETPVTLFTTLSNAAILAIVPFFVNLTRNCFAILSGNQIFDGYEASVSEKITAVFLGYRAKSPKYCFPMEKQIENSKKFHFVLYHAEKTDFCNSQEMWVTPGVPFLLFIALGFGIQLFYGDLVFNLYAWLTL